MACRTWGPGLCQTSLAVVNMIRSPYESEQIVNPRGREFGTN